MSVVRINAITVPAERADELVERFANRAGEVAKMPGFEAFELLRPTDGRDVFYVYTRWRSTEDFERWLNSPAFRHGHRADAAERGSHGDRADAAERGSHGDRADAAERGSHGDRADAAERGSHGDRADAAERGSHGDRAHSTQGPVGTGSEVLAFDVVQEERA